MTDRQTQTTEPTEDMILVPIPSWDVIYELRQGLSAYMSEFFCSGDDQTDNDAAGAWLDRVEAALPPCEEQDEHT